MQGKFVEGETLLSEDLSNVRAKLPTDESALGGRLHHLALALLLQERFAEAEPFARESLELREKKTPAEWSTFSSRSLLGGAMLGQKKYADAEPLLVSGYEGMREREANIPAARKLLIRQALERLVKLYEATDQPQKTAEWKAKLTEFNNVEIR